jgi:hypothetical protein
MRFVSLSLQNHRSSSSDLVSLRTAHLGMIQGVISRMSDHSSTAKNFAVTVAVAVIAIAYDKDAPPVLWAGILAMCAFLVMDAYYHLLEVRYRGLYRSVAEQPIEAGSNLLLDAPPATRANRLKVLKSRGLLPFYVLLLFPLLFALYEAPHVSAHRIETITASARDTGSNAGHSPAATERVGGAVRVIKGTDAERPRGPAQHAAASEE